MTKPATQATILKEIGFFPAVKSDLSHLSPGVQMASQGIRVLAVATATAVDQQWAESQLDYHYSLSGLVGFADPIRDSVPAAIAECQRAGIRVVMITGDHPHTATAIAREIGIASAEDIATAGVELDKLSDDELLAKFKANLRYAKVSDERAAELADAILNIDSLSDVQPLADAIAGAVG